MNWSDIPRNPSRKTLRQFAGLAVLFFGGLAAWRGWAKGQTEIAWLLGSGGGALGVLGLFLPQSLRFIFVGWMMLVFPIGWIVSRVILATLFFGLLTPLAQLFKLLGRDAVALLPRGHQASYWQNKTAVNDLSRYFQQF